MGRIAVFMVVKLFVGTILGFLSGLGIGGGSLLILWLTLVLGTDHTAARAINLLFFLPCAAIAACFRWTQGSLDLKKILPAMIAGAGSAAFFSFLGQRLDVTLLKKGFGILLLATGLREILYKTK